jgi:hypothetical protein
MRSDARNLVRATLVAANVPERDTARCGALQHAAANAPERVCASFVRAALLDTGETVWHNAPTLQISNRYACGRLTAGTIHKLENCMSIRGRKLFAATITHVPTGESVCVDSQVARNMQDALHKGHKLLLSRVYALTHECANAEHEYTYELPEDIQYPDDLLQYRHKLGE